MYRAECCAAFRENTDITNKCRMRILKYWTPRHGTSNATFASKFTVRKGQCSYIYSIGSALRVGEGSGRTERIFANFGVTALFFKRRTEMRL